MLKALVDEGSIAICQNSIYESTRSFDIGDKRLDFLISEMEKLQLARSESLGVPIDMEYKGSTSRKTSIASLPSSPSFIHPVRKPSKIVGIFKSLTRNKRSNSELSLASLANSTPDLGALLPAINLFGILG